MSFSLEADHGLCAVTVYFPERHHLHLVPGELPSQKQINDGGLVIPVSLYGEFSVDVLIIHFLLICLLNHQNYYQ
jgi:hypothetical protein